MAARTVITAFYGIDIKTHNDPYISFVEGPLEELGKTMTGIPGLVVCLFLYFSLCALSRTSCSMSIDFLNLTITLRMCSPCSRNSRLGFPGQVGLKSPEVEEGNRRDD
jgi:hypothetical protein